ncbi:MarR family transcriptional regulator [Candidatus Pacearchaeota archaeon]|nr:MarR family transcriptional regulator [Candidatus Pacearchaeota archaeon]
MQIRKKQSLDGIDREILRLLYKISPLVSSQIAKKVGLTAAAIAPRLHCLQKKGIIKKSKVSKIRTFHRVISGKSIIIHAPRSIYWGIDLKDG